MRTTVNLDPDVAAAVGQLRRDRGIGLSEAVNELARVGLSTPRRGSGQKRVHLPTRPMHLRIDVSNIADALDIAEAADGTGAGPHAGQPGQPGQR